MPNDFPLTDEQQAAVDAFHTGSDLLIEAGAGAGKTATLVAIGEHEAPRRGLYLAFNKALTEDAKDRMPGNVEARTVHSLAYRSVMPNRPALQARLRGGKRLDRRAEAKLLGLGPVTIRTPMGDKRLSAGYLAGYVMDGIRRFCQSGDPRPEAKHLPIVETIDAAQVGTGRRGPNNWDLANAHVRALRTAWDDLTDDDGVLRFGHDHYLKMWQLDSPRVGADFLMLDEAQDLSGVMREVILAQREHGVQLCFVGDPAQAIYGFTGATDAMRYLAEAGAPKVQLTKSFRFGPAVADVANAVLDRLDDSDLRVVGHDPVPSTIDALTDDDTDCVLTRTNAKAVTLALTMMDNGMRVAIADALKTQVVSFARAADDLMGQGWTSHRELAPFSSWDEVQRFVDEDFAGKELELMVKLVDRFGADVIQARLTGTVNETRADIVLSTAHTSKGREWDRVQIADDFPQRDEETGAPPELSPDEARLLYVAVTRAKLVLDLDGVDWLLPGAAPAEAAAGVDA